MDAGLAAYGHGWPIAAGPRSRTGARACRATARHRMSGARALGYLGPGGVPFFQVTRRKGGTNSGRNRNNGYVHQEENARPKGRHRWQVGSPHRSFYRYRCSPEFREEPYYYAEIDRTTSEPLLSCSSYATDKAHWQWRYPPAPVRSSERRMCSTSPPATDPAADSLL